MLVLPLRRNENVSTCSTVVLLFLITLYTRTARSFVMRPSAKRNHFMTRNERHRLHMDWNSGISHEPDGIKAVQEILKDFNGKRQEGLAFLFVNQQHAKSFDDIVTKAYGLLQKHENNYQMLALVGGGVIGGGEEADSRTLPSVSILYGSLPKGSSSTAFGIESENDEAWKPKKLKENGRPPSYILFVDPWASTSKVLEEMDDQDGPQVVVGGVSCPSTMTDSTVAYNDVCLPAGSVVGVCLEGNVGIQALVAQGCRPVGQAFRVTGATQNVITELDGKSALEQLEKVVSQDASTQDKAIIQSGGLLCGVISSSNLKKDSTPQDFLARQIIGFQPRMNQGNTNEGAIVIATPIQVGDLFAFHVRDATAAQEDFQVMVQRYKTERLFSMEGQTNAGIPMAALQISCVARGQSLFGRPNVDLEQTSELFSFGGASNKATEGQQGESITESPIAGFFANGEIGPVGLAGFSDDSGGSTHVHSFTTVVAMLCDYSNADNESSENDTSSVPTTTSQEEFSSFGDADAWG